MSLSIPTFFEDISHVAVHADTRKMSNQMIRSYQKMYKTGIIKDAGAAQKLAFAARASGPYPVLWLDDNRGILRWDGMAGEDKFFEFLMRASGALALSDPPLHARHDRQLKTFNTAAVGKAAWGKFINLPFHFSPLLNGYAPPVIESPAPDIVTLDGEFAAE